MREIEFRGKHNGIFVYGYLNIIDNVATIRCGKNIFIVDVNTVGQFTGLSDINDIKIYEGDILEFTRGIGNWTGKTITTKHEVCWDSTVARFSLGKEQEAMKFRKHYNYRYVVIGNICDNPEMIDNN